VQHPKADDPVLKPQIAVPQSKEFARRSSVEPSGPRAGFPILTGDAVDVSAEAGEITLQQITMRQCRCSRRHWSPSLQVRRIQCRLGRNGCKNREGCGRVEDGADAEKRRSGTHGSSSNAEKLSRMGCELLALHLHSALAAC